MRSRTPLFGLSMMFVEHRQRISEASQTGTKIADAGFSYSVRGEITDVYESTAHSGGYYHVNATYWAHGAVNTLSGLAGLPTITYGADGEGRLNAVSAATAQNPVTSTTYNVASQATEVNLGSLDSDNFIYDPNTSRITQYKFTVNSQSVIGNLGWNANGTLSSLNITDPFNSADTQNCSYAHDDLARIASANCGAAWAQTFSYDPFGNINKTGSMSFQPTYSPTTNRMTQLPGFTPSYDANGNLTNDSLHIYSWDAEGRPVTIDSVGLTYDALGRMVEQNRSGAYTEIVYGPTGGKLALMNGQALQKAFVPLPAGATAVYNSSGLSYYRHPDWLGSSRFGSTPTRAVYSDVAYAPFGEPYAQAGTLDLSFTGQNQDTVSGLYDFLYREYSIQGRWPSPDPAGLAAVDLNDPQSVNSYAYVRNEAMNLVDPLGLQGPTFMDFPADWSCSISGISVSCALLGSGAGGPTGGGFWRPIPGNGESGPTGCWREVFTGAVWCPSRYPFYSPGTGQAPTGAAQSNGGSTLDDRANALANALNKTGVQSLGNPCTVAAFYAASALGGASGGALAGGEAAGTASTIYEASAPYWPVALAYVRRQELSGFPIVRGLTWAYGKARNTVNAVQRACNSMQ